MFETSKWIARAPYPKRMNFENMPVCQYLTKDFELKGAVKSAIFPSQDSDKALIS